MKKLLILPLVFIWLQGISQKKYPIDSLIYSSGFYRNYDEVSMEAEITDSSCNIINFKENDTLYIKVLKKTGIEVKGKVATSTYLSIAYHTGCTLSYTYLNNDLIYITIWTNQYRKYIFAITPLYYAENKFVR